MNLLEEEGGDSDGFEVSGHVSKQIAISQKLCTRGGVTVYVF